MKLTNPVIRPRDRLAVQRVYRRCLYGFIFRQHDRILTLTDAETSALRATYPKISDRFVTVPNPYVSTELLTENPRKRSSIEGGPRLVTLARLMPQKRLDVLLHAFARVKHLDSRLTILGDGPLRAPLEGLALSLGIADRVEMPGFVEDVLPALREADLFVLSSDYEGLPAAMIEALACNVPVVTTDCFFGARSMLGSSAYCAVTPVGDAVELAAAIDRLLVLGPPTGLCELAAVYGMEASIAAHESVMRSLMGMEAA